MLHLKIPVDQVHFAMSPVKIGILTITPHVRIEDIGIKYVQFQIEEKFGANRSRIFWKYFRSTWLQLCNTPTWNIHGLDPMYIVNRINNALEGTTAYLILFSSPEFNHKFNELLKTYKSETTQ